MAGRPTPTPTSGPPPSASICSPRLHDLVVGSSGTRDGKKFSVTSRYRFNGTEYVLLP
jgi:hypothetical protein